MDYRIRFISGEPNEKIFFFLENSISIGRSLSNTVCLKNPQVSGRHIILTKTPNGIEIECLSLRKVEVDGTKVGFGERAMINAGQVISIADGIDFILESFQGVSNEDTNTIFDEDVSKDSNTMVDKTISPDANEKTVFEDLRNDLNLDTLGDKTKVVPINNEKFSSKKDVNFPKTKSVNVERDDVRTSSDILADISGSDDEEDEENKTICMQTRMASPEEVEFMRNVHAKTAKKKLAIWVCCVVLFFALIIGVYFSFFHHIPEQYITWPKSGDKYLVETLHPNGVEFKDEIFLEIPKAPSMKIQHKDKSVSIYTRTGRDLDVPLFVLLEVDEKVENLRLSRVEAFQQWMNKKKQGTENWNFEQIQPISFYGAKNGIPYNSVQYTRINNNNVYYGSAEFFRYAKYQFVLLKEIPLTQKWRGEYFIRNELFLSFTDKIIASHWEGKKEFVDVNVKDSVDEAKIFLSKDLPSNWQKVDFLLKNALISAHLKNDNTENIKNAESLLVSLRERQNMWFNAQRLLYKSAEIRKDKAAKTQIRNNSKAVFSSVEDMRFHKVRQNKWN